MVQLTEGDATSLNKPIEEDGHGYGINGGAAAWEKLAATHD